MKDRFHNPEIEIVKFDIADIITTSDSPIEPPLEDLGLSDLDGLSPLPETP